MPSFDASNSTNGQTVRRTRLNPDRLERKRATDPETQCAIRAKTKSHIEHLKSTVQRYEQSTGDDLTRELAAKVSERHLEISRLRDVVKNAHKILAFAISGEDANEENDPRHLPSNGDVPGQAIEASPAWTADGLSNAPDRASSSNVPHDDISNVPSNLHEGTAPETAARQPTQPSLPPSENPLACGEGDGNCLELLSTETTNLQNDTSFCPLTSAEEDEDVAIRAIFASWDSTEERHRLGPVWKLLKALDQGLFYRSGPVERVAVLRLMRSMLLYQINPFWQHPTP
jgi:hypothetical protein